MSSQVLVTGAAGFIGSHVCRCLIHACLSGYNPIAGRPTTGCGVIFKANKGFTAPRNRGHCPHYTLHNHESQEETSIEKGQTTEYIHESSHEEEEETADEIARHHFI